MEWESLIYFWRVQWRRQRQIDVSLPTRREGVPLLFQFHFYLRINFLLVIVPGRAPDRYHEPYEWLNYFADSVRILANLNSINAKRELFVLSDLLS